jgi:hypothetical protein
VLTRFRSLRFRSNLLPVVLFALVLRLLVPSDSMAVSGDGMSIAAPMCAIGIEQRSSPVEKLRIPGFVEKLHCEFCGAPLAAAPFAAPALVANDTRQAPPPLLSSQRGLDLIARAQSARAPPAG